MRIIPGRNSTTTTIISVSIDGKIGPSVSFSTDKRKRGGEREVEINGVTGRSGSRIEDEAMVSNYVADNSSSRGLG